MANEHEANEYARLRVIAAYVEVADFALAKAGELDNSFASRGFSRTPLDEAVRDVAVHTRSTLALVEKEMKALAAKAVQNG